MCILLQMMVHAWSNYVKYAWGQNELRPISKSGHSAGIFGQTALGATIIDAADTLYIMGLHDEYQKARDWIANSFDVNSVSFARAAAQRWGESTYFVECFSLQYFVLGPIQRLGPTI